VVQIKLGVKLMGSGQHEFSKSKSRLCSMGNQQLERLQYNAQDLYALVLTPDNLRLLAVIAVANKTYMIKYNTTQAFLYWDVVEDLYTRAPSMVASAGETDWDLAGTQFPRNCVPYNIIEFQV
jgi:hypothetical protein